MSRQPGQKVARNTLLSLVALGVLGGTRIAYGAIISRVTDLETFGVVGTMIAISLLASYMLPAGIGAAVSRFIPFERGAGDVERARGSHRLLSSLSAAAATSLGILAAATTLLVLKRPLDESVEVGLLTIAYSVYTTEKAAMYAFDRVDAYLRVEIFTSIMAVSLAIAVAAVGSTAYLLPLIMQYAVFSAVARWALRDATTGARLAPDSRGRRDLIGYAALAGLGILAGAGALQGTQLLAVWFASRPEVALFVAAVTLTTPLYFLPRALALALFPSMAEAYGAGDVGAVQRHADLASRGLFACGAVVLVAAELSAPATLALFGGGEYVAGAGVLRVIMLAAYLTIIAVPSINSLSTGPGWQLKTPVGWSIAGCLTGLALVIAIGGSFGAIGVASSYLAGTAVTSIGPLIAASRRLRMNWIGPVVRGIGLVSASVVIGTVVEERRGDVVGLLYVAGVAAIGTTVATLVVGRDLLSAWRGIRPPASGDGDRRRAGPIVRPVHGQTR